MKHILLLLEGEQRIFDWGRKEALDVPSGRYRDGCGGEKS
jgi:hypothetical protein